MIQVENIDGNNLILTDDADVFFQHENGGQMYHIGVTQDKKIALADIDTAYQNKDVKKGKYYYFYVLDGKMHRLDSVKIPTILHAKGTGHQKSFFKPENGQFMSVFPKKAFYEYKFSIIMAVYNVEEYIEEAIESVLNQTEKSVQLILVNDGTPDRSGKIARQYAQDYENIIYLEQENQGVSSARNLGMTVATGEFWNFMDPDDTLSKNTLKDVYKFFKPRKHLTDVVTIPIYFFGDKTGKHPLNKKFDHGTRIINLLNSEEKDLDLSLAASFLTKEVFKSKSLDLTLKISEDMLLINEIMLEKLALGVVSDGAYNYRRIEGFGAIFNTQTNMSFEDTVARFNSYQRLAEMSIRKYGTVVKFIQLVIIYDINWQLRLEKFKNDLCLTDEQKKILVEEYVFGTFEKFIDVELINNSSFLSKLVKEYIIFRIGNARNGIFVQNRFGVWMNTKQVVSLDEIKATFVVANHENNTISMYYTVSRPSLIKKWYPNLAVTMSVGNKTIQPAVVEDDSINHNMVLGKHLLEFELYRFDIDLKDDNLLDQPIKLVMKDKSLNLNKKVAVSFNKHEFSSLSNEIKIDSISDKYVSKLNEGVFSLSYKGRFEEMLLLDTAFGNDRAKKFEYLKLEKNKNKPVWLFEDRPNQADDNGEAMFKYVVKNHPEIDAYFVLSEESPDWERISKIGKTLDKFSENHVKMWAIADLVIGAQAEYQIINPVAKGKYGASKKYFQSYYKSYRILNKPQFVFLQHGILRSTLHFHKWLNLANKNIKLLVTTAKYEREELLRSGYHYNENIVQLLGIPRLDALVNSKKKTEKIILFMPTWRKNLNTLSDEQFVKTNYYTEIMSFFNDRRVQKAVSKKRYKIVFKIHPNLKPYIHLFNLPKMVEVSEESYRELYEKSAIALTDFSSAVLDFAYIKKPVIQYQFDDQSYYYEHTFDRLEGEEEQAIYFNVYKNGEYTAFVEELINQMSHPMMDIKYQNKIDNDFPVRDGQNSTRVFEAIKEMVTKDKI